MKLLKDSLICLLLVSGIGLCAKSFVVLNHVQKSVIALKGDIALMADSSTKTLDAATKAVNKVEQASEEQRLYWKVISHDTARTIESANTLIQNTDARLNQGLLPQMTASLRTSSESFALVARQTSDTIQHLDSGLSPVLSSSLAASHSLNNLAADPNLILTLRNLREAAEHANTTLFNAESATQDVSTAIHDLTHPKKHSFAYRSTLFLLKQSVPVANWLTAAR